MPPHYANGRARELLRFCEYVARRLHSENLELLRRVIVEFHATPRAFTTVEALLAAGFPAVTVLPVANDDDAPRALVAVAPRRRARRPSSTAPHALQELYEATRDKLQLSNWRWLLRMYDDYSNGVETTIAEFVACRPAAIAMFPIAPLNPPSPIGELKCKDDDTKTLDKEETVSSPLSVDKTSEEEEEEPEEQEESVVEIVAQAFQRVERKAPWERVYDVATIAYPFDSAKYPGLAQRLLAFWEQHARAVWERNFWLPLAESAIVPGSSSYVRKQRQREAAVAFTYDVVQPIFETFGARFFVDMDAYGREVYWWWYRRAVVDLGKMALAVGVDKCVRYTAKQARKRVPRLPDHFQARGRSVQHGEPVSMWSTMRKVQFIAAAIEVAKDAAEKRPAKRQAVALGA